MSDARLDEVFVMTVGSACLNQMDLSPDLWVVSSHEVHISARTIADVLVWHEKYPDDTRVLSSDCNAALCFLGSLDLCYARAAVTYVYESCAGDDVVAGRVFGLITQYCASRTT